MNERLQTLRKYNLWDSAKMSNEIKSNGTNSGSTTCEIPPRSTSGTSETDIRIK